MENFEIKRGMVFFIDMTKIQPASATGLVPTKVRPYVVLSNDFCNQSSPTIHVAPIYTKAYKDTAKKWYLIPFKEADNRESAVDIASIMLVPKAYCKSTNYNQTLTNLVRYNKNLFEMIDAAICKQFAVDTVQTRLEVEKTMQEYPVYNAPIPVPNITLNISVNGIPVSKEAISVNAEVGNSVTNDNICENQKATTEPNFEKVTLKKGSSTTNREKKEKIIKFVRENYKDFGGTYTVTQLVKATGVSVSTVYRCVNKIKADAKKHWKKSTLPKEQYKEFVEYCMTHKVEEALEKYSKYGITTAEKMKNKVKNIKYELSRCLKK